MTDWVFFHTDISTMTYLENKWGVFLCLWERACLCVCAYFFSFFFGIRGYPPLTVFAHLHLLTSLYSSYQTNYHCRFPRLFCLRSLYIKNNFPALSKISTLWTLSNLTFRRSFLFLFCCCCCECHAFYSVLLSWSAASSRSWPVVVTGVCIYSWVRIPVCACMRLF